MRPALKLIAFAPLEPTEATLGWLALALVVLSVAVWFAAALVGRLFCRRALAPLTRMSAAARDAVDPSDRLPLPGTRDELEDLGRAFNGLLDRLEEALERQRRFTGDASHQLRTPLAGLLSQVDVAMRRERPAEEYKRVLGVVRNKGAALRQIIESLLFLARAESESGRPELELVELSSWVTAYFRSWAAHPRIADIQLITQDEGPFPIRASSAPGATTRQLAGERLQIQSLRNPDRAPAHRREGSAVLAVMDVGYGLTPEEQTRIFQPFYRAPEARSLGLAGVGLGLAVAAESSRFSAASSGFRAPGRGTRFEVILPLSSDPQNVPVAQWSHQGRDEIGAC